MSAPVALQIFVGFLLFGTVFIPLDYRPDHRPFRLTSRSPPALDSDLWIVVMSPPAGSPSVDKRASTQSVAFGTLHTECRR